MRRPKPKTIQTDAASFASSISSINAMSPQKRIHAPVLERFSEFEFNKSPGVDANADGGNELERVPTAYDYHSDNSDDEWKKTDDISRYDPYRNNDWDGEVDDTRYMTAPGMTLRDMEEQMSETSTIEPQWRSFDEDEQRPPIPADPIMAERRDPVADWTSDRRSDAERLQNYPGEGLALREAKKTVMNRNARRNHRPLPKSEEAARDDDETSYKSDFGLSQTESRFEGESHHDYDDDDDDGDDNNDSGDGDGDGDGDSTRFDGESQFAGDSTRFDGESQFEGESTRFDGDSQFEGESTRYDGESQFEGGSLYGETSTHNGDTDKSTGKESRGSRRLYSTTSLFDDVDDDEDDDDDDDDDDNDDVDDDVQHYQHEEKNDDKEEGTIEPGTATVASANSSELDEAALTPNVVPSKLPPPVNSLANLSSRTKIKLPANTKSSAAVQAEMIRKVVEEKERKEKEEAKKKKDGRKSRFGGFFSRRNRTPPEEIVLPQPSKGGVVVTAEPSVLTPTSIETERVPQDELIEKKQPTTPSSRQRQRHRRRQKENERRPATTSSAFEDNRIGGSPLRRRIKDSISNNFSLPRDDRSESPRKRRIMAVLSPRHRPPLHPQTPTSAADPTIIFDTQRTRREADNRSETSAFMKELEDSRKTADVDLSQAVDAETILKDTLIDSDEVEQALGFTNLSDGERKHVGDWDNEDNDDNDKPPKVVKCLRNNHCDGMAAFVLNGVTLIDKVGCKQNFLFLDELMKADDPKGIESASVVPARSFTLTGDEAPKPACRRRKPGSKSAEIDASSIPGTIAFPRGSMGEDVSQMDSLEPGMRPIIQASKAKKRNNLTIDTDANDVLANDTVIKTIAPTTKKTKNRLRKFMGGKNKE